MSDDGIPWLTNPQRDFLAHLTVITLLPQMQRLKPDHGYTYDRLSDAWARSPTTATSPCAATTATCTCSSTASSSSMPPGTGWST